MKKFLLLALCFIAFSQGVFAAITINSGASGCYDATTAHTVVSGSLSITAGDTIAVGLISAANVAAPSLEDTLTSSWSGGTQQDSTDVFNRIYYTINSAGGTDVITATRFSGHMSMCVLVWAGGHTTAAFDQENGMTGSFQTGQPGSVTPSDNGQIVVTVVSKRASGTSTIDGGFTILGQVAYNPGVNQQGVALAYLIQTTATAANPTWDNINYGFSQSITIATFKAAAVAPSTVCRRSLLGVGC